MLPLLHASCSSQPLHKLDAEGNVINDAAGKPVVIPVKLVSFISTPKTRWTYDEMALRRCGRLFPFVAKLDLSTTNWDARKKSDFNALFAKATASWNELKPVTVLLAHMAAWQRVMVRTAQPQGCLS